MEEVYDSPVGWVNRHVRGYVESGGRKGHRWSGVHTLLLTTRGRKTG
ncbi:MAG TPA: nitroreductase/quinone reductase family protein, partial [Actinomycetota bacterium]